MAKQAGEIFIEGTIEDLTFYRMDEMYYVRMKSSLTSKRFWKSKAFGRSRDSCKRFSEGNALASRLYRMIEEGKGNYKLFCFLKRKAIQLLKEGKSLRKAEEVLMDYLTEFDYLEKSDEEIMKQSLMWQPDLNEDHLKRKLIVVRQEFQLDG